MNYNTIIPDNPVFRM